AGRERRYRRARLAGRAGRRLVIAQGREDRGPRLVRHLHVLAAPVLVVDRHAVRLRPARELCSSCHRTSLPDRAPPPTRTQPRGGHRSLKGTRPRKQRISGHNGTTIMKYLLTI